MVWDCENLTREVECKEGGKVELLITVGRVDQHPQSDSFPALSNSSIAPTDLRTFCGMAGQLYDIHDYRGLSEPGYQGYKGVLNRSSSLTNGCTAKPKWYTDITHRHSKSRTSE